MTLMELLAGNAEAQAAVGIVQKPEPEPGFCPAALALRDKQEALLDKLVEAGFFQDELPEACKPLLGQYELNIEEARMSGLIKTAHACCVDPISYETFHNVYKSDVGIRPRGFITYEGMHLWLERRPKRAR